MDLMLDDDLHISLPEADVSAFFKVELRSHLRSLKAKRIVEHVDGSMTTAKARSNNLEAVVLNGLSEDGLRKEMPQARLAALSPVLRNEAAGIQRAKYSEFMSAEFNEGVEKRARSSVFCLLPITTSYFCAKQQSMPGWLRTAHWRPCLCFLLIRQGQQPLICSQPLFRPHHQPHNHLPTSQTFKHQHLSRHRQHLPSCPMEWKGIKGRITSQTINRQRDQAVDQPEEQSFDGIADNAVTERVYGSDLFGTTVRMARKSRAQDDTNQQKLKSASLFIYITGIQMVTDIRQHHLDMFAHALEHDLPKHYWKSQTEKNLTFKELLEINRNKSKDVIGLSSTTIGRHLKEITNVIEFADAEGNKATFVPRTADLIPPDKRSDAEKRSVYTLEDARSVFQHPLWQGSKSKARRHTKGPLVIKDHHYWINLLLAYTGARRSEIAGLLETDIGHEVDIP